MRPIVLIFAVLLFAGIPLCACLYEEQAGSFDWYREGVGQVAQAHFHKQLYVASEQGVLAALHMKTGSPVWRRTLRKAAVNQLLPKDNKLFTIAGGGDRMSMWTIGGEVIWDEVTAPSHYVAASEQPVVGSWLNSDVDEDGELDVAILAKGVLQVRSGGDGKLLWSKPAGQHVTTLSVHRDTIHLVGYDRLSRSVVTHSFRASNGEEASPRREFPVAAVVGQEERDSGPSGLGVVADSGYALWTEQGSVKVVLLGSSTLHTVPIPKVAAAAAGGRWIVQSESVLPKALLLQYSSPSPSSSSFSVWCQLVGLSTSSSSPSPPTIELVKEFPPLSVAATSHLPEDGGHEVAVAVVVATPSTTDTLIEIYEEVEDRGAPVHQVRIPLTGVRNGGVQALFAGRVPNKGAYRVAVVGRDHSLWCTHGGELMWTRAEALATVAQVEWVELPEQHSKGGSSSSLYTTTTTSNITASIMDRDSFGFRQLLVTLSPTAHKAFGVHSESGAVVWERYFPSSMVDGGGGSGVSPQRLFLSRPLPPPFSAREVLPPVLSVLLAPTSSSSTSSSSSLTSSGSAVLLSIDPLTGRDIPDSPAIALPSNLLHVRQLPLATSNHCYILMAVDASHQVHLVPDTAESRAIFHRERGHIHYHLLDPVHNTLEGYSVQPIGSSSSSSSSSSNYVGIKLWSVAFPSSGGTEDHTGGEREEQVVGMAMAAPREPHSSPIRVLGDRTALYKYLNRAMVAVATYSRAADGGTLHIYLFDGVSGSLLVHHHHRQTIPPVHLTISENWVVYHYWSTKNHRYELVTWELYEEAIRWDKHTTTTTASSSAPLDLSTTAPSSSSSHNGSLYFTSWENVRPRALQQAYIFPTAVDVLALTETGRGVTSKQLLVGTASGQLVGLSRRLVDPRRPKKEELTEAAKEEGLVPYTPQLKYSSKAVLNYYNSIADIRGVVAAPATLESTSLVFAYGVDLFFTRTAPSKSFDMLNEDFNYYALLGTAIVLLVLTVWTSGKTKRRALLREWR